MHHVAITSSCVLRKHGRGGFKYLSMLEKASKQYVFLVSEKATRNPHISDEITANTSYLEVGLPPGKLLPKADHTR